MKTGTIIKIKSPELKKIRNNLRSLWLTIAKESFHRTMDLAEVQFSVENLLGAQRLDVKARDLYDCLYHSICRCDQCRNTERDAVFVHYSLIDQFIYPPLNEHEEHSRSYWLCPECYEKLKKKIEFYKKEGYYFFRDLGIFDTLDSIGIDSLDDLDKFQED